MDRQCLAELDDCIFDFAFFQERNPEVVMGIGIIGLQFNCLPEMRDGIVELSLTRESVADVQVNQREAQGVMRIRTVSGSDIERTLKMRERIGELSAIHQEHSEVCLSNIVVLGHSESVRPKRFAVSPISCLLEGAASKNQDDDSASRTKDLLAVSELARKIDNPPDQRQIQTDLREIRVTVGVTLKTDFHDSNHW